MQKIYEISYFELGIDVRYKILSEFEVSKLTMRITDAEEDSARHIVMETVIQNLKTDVANALRKVSKEKANKILVSLYNSCIMLNPGIDLITWVNISIAPTLVSEQVRKKVAGNKIIDNEITSGKVKRVTRQKFLNLQRHLESKVVGQLDAIDELVKVLKRSQAGLSDENRPIASFMFAGSSGVGKSYLARVLQEYLFDNAKIIRIDCGEFQQKHEVSKILGSPPAYVGYEDRNLLKDALEENPSTVLLIDEIEKAHPDIFNVFLPILDEGYMTDSHNNKLDFKNCIIIMTTNLGNKDVVEQITSINVGFGKRDKGLPSRDYIVNHTKEAINKHFQPEFINRFDKIVVFNNLNPLDYAKIAELELEKTNQKLEKRGCSLQFDKEVIEAMVNQGVNHVQAVRGLAQLRRDKIEDPLANLILKNRYVRGTVFQLSYNVDHFEFSAHKPVLARPLRATGRATIAKNATPIA